MQNTDCPMVMVNWLEMTTIMANHVTQPQTINAKPDVTV